MPSPPSPSLPTRRPRVTPRRCATRLRDRLELLLERFVDKVPGVQADFAAYKADRDRSWGEADTATNKGAVAAVTPAVDTLYDRAPVETPCSLGQQHAQLGIVASGRQEDEQIEDRSDGQERGGYPGDNVGIRGFLGDTGLATKARKADMRARPRNVSGSSTFSSVVDAALREARRRKRKLSDARPGYFDPDPFPRTTGHGGTTAATGGGDELVMNIPVELENRSRAGSIGIAR
ncbi:hypothetical protein EsH8_V_000772 [Colletotrichum jinshuiense]